MGGGRLGVEQAMKKWESEKFRAQSAGKIFAAALPLFQFAPSPLIGDTCLFAIQLRPFML